MRWSECFTVASLSCIHPAFSLHVCHLSLRSRHSSGNAKAAIADELKATKGFLVFPAMDEEHPVKPNHQLC